ncbi:MAG: hypothetical protein M0Z41_07530 [Peptococcaceae bacterium]|jgi:sulfopyruvate decarboxylase subunit alpha|nr:hypothetical protein [Peptococcaceae bacterium]
MIGQIFQEAGIDLGIYLPDTWLDGLIKELKSMPDFTLIPVSREDDGVGMAAGACLAGKRSVLIIQNAGLFVAANAFVNLALLYRLPFLVLASYRGYLGERHHIQIIKGRKSVPFLEGLGVPWVEICSRSDLPRLVDAANYAYGGGEPVVALLTREALSDD